MLVRIAYYYVDARQSRDLVWGALGVAAGDYNPRFRILATHSPDGSTCVLIGRGRDRAGVQNDDRRVLRILRASQAALFELALQCGAIGLRRSATEVFYVIAGHMSMLSQRELRGLRRERQPVSQTRLLNPYFTGARTSSSRSGVDSTRSRCG